MSDRPLDDVRRIFASIDLVDPHRALDHLRGPHPDIHGLIDYANEVFFADGDPRLGLRDDLPAGRPLAFESRDSRREELDGSEERGDSPRERERVGVRVRGVDPQPLEQARLVDRLDLAEHAPDLVKGALVALAIVALHRPTLSLLRRLVKAGRR